MMNPKSATTLRQLVRNCNPQMKINASHPFYANVDAARNPGNLAPVRNRMKNVLLNSASDNLDIFAEQQDLEEIVHKKLLLVGHRASGKSTELQLLKDDITAMYETVFIENVNVDQDRFNNEKEFIFFIAEQIVSHCEKNPYLQERIGESVTKLYNYLYDNMFSKVTDITETSNQKSFSANAEISAEAEAQTGIIFKLTAKLIGNLSANKTYNQEQKTVIENNKVTYFDGFLNLVNEMIHKMNLALIQKGKLLLLIIDGLDKIADKTKTERIFIGDTVTLTNLDCSMIVTYPLYLMFSTDHARAISRFDGEPFKLRQIKVHDRDQSPCDEGIQAMEDIISRRIDVETLMENPDDLKTAILNSGGNIRDLFGYLVFAATNAEAWDLKKIRSIDLELAYEDKQGMFNAILTKEYMTVLKELYEDNTKESVVTENSSRNVLLELFEGEMVAEYNGTGWYDLHPMLKAVLERKIESGVIS